MANEALTKEYFFQNYARRTFTNYALFKEDLWNAIVLLKGQSNEIFDLRLFYQSKPTG